MEKLFPSDIKLLLYTDVIAFAYGLTNHPDDVMDVLHERTMTRFTDFAITELRDRQNIMVAILTEDRQRISIQRYMAAERVEARTSNSTRRTRFLCVLRHSMKDFVPSRNYILEYLDGTCAGVIYQDPAFPRHDLQEAKRSDPAMYILNTHESALNFAMAVMKKLSECYDIRITKLISENLDKFHDNAIQGIYDIQDFIPPEGCLNLNISPSKRWVSWTIVTQIKEKKMRQMLFSESAVVCFEQFADSVFLGSNMKSLEKSGYELPSPVIQHLAREFYGCDKSASPKGEECCQGYSSGTKDTKHSRFTILHISNALVSRDESKCLAEPMRLTHLRVLHISSYCLDANLDDLGLNYTSLEELHLYSVVDWKSNEYIRMDIQTKGSHSASLLDQDPKNDTDRLRNTKCFQKLRLISVWGVVTDRIVDLLRLELPALRIDLDHLYYDTETLPEVISMLAPHLNLLCLYGNMLIGQLGNLIGGASDQKQPCIFQCLEQLFVEYFDSEISMGIDALAEQVGCGKFPCLVRLGVTYMNRPNSEVETVLENLARTCVDYYEYGSLSLIIQCDTKWSFSREFKVILRSLLASPSHFLGRLQPRRERQISQFAIVHYES